MPFPTTSNWTIFDFDSSNISTIMGYTESTVTGGAGDVTTPGNYVRMLSDDSSESSLSMDVSVTQNFSLEMNFYGDDLPADLTTLNTKRVYIAAYDQQDNSVGLVISQSGLAVVDAVSGTASLAAIPGSSSLISEDTWYTIRLVVDGEHDTLYVYITPTASLAATGHMLRYMMVSPSTPLGQADEAKVEVFGTAADPTEIDFDVYRLSSLLRIPNKPPIAVPGEDRQVLSGEYIKLDGTGSYDPEGEDLTYQWRLLSAPKDSEYLSIGYGGLTPTEPDVDSTTNIFECADGFDSDNLAAGDLLVVGSVLAEIDSSSFDAVGALVNPQQLVLTTEALVEGQSGLMWNILHQNCIGNATSSVAYARIDTTGLYGFGLTVNDGSLDSTEAEVLIQSMNTHLVKSSIPDLSYMWKCVGDEWDFVADKEKIEKIWSAFSLVAAGYLYWSWQVHACGSLERIPETLARKWVGLPTRINPARWDKETINEFHPPIMTSVGASNIDGETLDIVVGEYEYEVEFSGTNPIPAIDTVNQINAELPETIAEVVDGKVAFKGESYWEVLSTGSANSILGLSTTENTKCYLNGSSATPRQYPTRAVMKEFIKKINILGKHYGVHIPSAAYHNIVDVTNGLANPSLPYTASVQDVLDWLADFKAKYNFHDHNDAGAVPTLYHIGGGGGHTITSTLPTDWSEAVDFYNDVIEVYILHCEDTHGGYHGAEHVTTGIVEEDAWEPGETELRVITISDPVYLTGLELKDKYILLGDELHKIEEASSYNHVRIKTPVAENKTYSWSIKPTIHLQGMDLSLVRFCSYDQIKMSFTPEDEDEDTVSIYVDSDGGISEYVTYDPTPWAYYGGTVTIEFLNKNQHIPVYKETVSIPYLQEEIVDASPLYEGKDYNLNVSNGVKWVDFVSPTTSPEVWWAEYLLFENDAIEDNFGYMVGVEAGDVDDGYLSIIRALFYSYWSGAKMDALKLGVHAIFGMPFTEAEGTIIDIDDFYSTRLGRILIEDSASDSDRVRVYYYDRDASIATNPDTEATYAVGDSIGAFVPLCSGVEITDYIEEEDWFQDYVTQGVVEEIEKYHTFYVGGDVDIFGYKNIILAQEFLNRAKEVRTDYIFAPYKTNVAEIDVNDVLELDVAIHLYDNVCPLSDGGTRKADDYDGSGDVRAEADEFGTTGDFVGADSILQTAKMDTPWEILSGGSTWEDMVAALQEAFTDLRNHMLSGIYHPTADSHNLPSFEYYPTTSFSLDELFYVADYLIDQYNNHDRNTGGAYHNTGGSYPLNTTTVYDVGSLNTAFNSLKDVFSNHRGDAAIHTFADGVNAITHDDLFIEDRWLPHAGPPYLIGNDWSSLPDPIASLSGKTLELNVSDGRMISELIACNHFNTRHHDFDFLSGTGAAFPTADSSTHETVLAWAGSGCPYVSGGSSIRYNPLGIIDGTEEKGTICFRFRPHANYLADPIPLPSVSYIFSWITIGNNNDVRIWASSAGTALDTLNASIYDSAGVNISSISGSFTPSSTWYEICYQWDVVNGYEELMVDGVSLGTDNSTGTRTTPVTDFYIGRGSGGAGIAEFYIDNLRIYNDVIHEPGYSPPWTEEYYDRGTRTITFGLGTAQDAMDDINEDFPGCAHLYYENDDIFHPLLFSWNRNIEVIGGTALDILGFEEGEKAENRERYHIIGADISSGLNIAGDTLDFKVDGTSYTATFTGPDPVSAATIISDINFVAPHTLARLSGNYLKLGSPFRIEVEITGTATADLGFDDTTPLITPIDYDHICIEDWIEIEGCEDYSGGLTKNQVIDELNTLGSSFENHISNTPGAYHSSVDTTNTLAVSSLPYTATFSECMDYINDVKAKLNAHDNNNGGAYHGIPSTHQVATSDAIDWGTLATLYAAIVTVFNAHIGDV